MRKFTLSGKKNYDFISKSGKEFQKCIFRFCQKMFMEESFPAEFLDTTLHMILKINNRSNPFPAEVSDSKIISYNLAFRYVSDIY